MRRREFLAAPVALALARAATPLRFSVCSETFQGLPFEEQCRLARTTGYAGIEVMPGGLAENPVAIPAARRRELRRTIADAGLEFVGLHNLLTVPAGWRATANDAEVRRRTWEFVRGLIDLCADLGPDGIMVFGSGKQRSAEAGCPIGEAVKRLRDGFASVAGHARERGVTILIEPLAPHLSNVVNRLEEAVAMVREIDSPAVRTMFDVHNTAAEQLSGAQLIGKYIGWIRHVHLNEMDGRRPGTGSYDFRALLRALEEHGYRGWLSLEVFDFRPSGEAVAAEALAHLQEGATEPLSFEVASVKPSAPGGTSGVVRVQPGNQTYIARNMPLRVIMTVAYTVTDRQISGGPEWVASDRFDIDAKADRPRTTDEMHAMLRRLLEDRFQLKVRHEKRELPVWALVVNKGGAKLTEHDANDIDHPPFGPGPNGRGLAGRNVSMPYFAFVLSRLLDRNVIDRTGLTKNYDMTLDFARDLPARPDGGQEPAAAQDGPTIFQAVREQLGLRLEAAKGPVEFLVIERAEKPSAN